MTRLDLEDVEARVMALKKFEEKAATLKPTIPKAQLYVGMAGIRLKFDQFDIIPEFLKIRRVSNPPGMVHVCAAANLRGSDYLGVARYSTGISAEIVVGQERLGKKNRQAGFLYELAWHTAALIKLRGFQMLVCPVSSTVSWDIIAGTPDHSVVFRMLDDVSRSIIAGMRRYSVAISDLQWITNNWERALELRNASTSRRFGLAFNIAYCWNHTSDLRVALANSWFGLEALFGIEGDHPVTKKLANRISSWIPGTDEANIRRLYDLRCDAIHGRWLPEKEIGGSIRQSYSLLRKALIVAIKRGQSTLPDWGK